MISGYGDEIPSFRGSRFIKHPTNFLGKRKSKKKITPPKQIDLSCASFSNIPCKIIEQPENNSENPNFDSNGHTNKNVGIDESRENFVNIKHKLKKKDFEKFSQRCQKKKNALKFKMNVIRMQTKIDEMSKLISDSIGRSTLPSNYLIKKNCSQLNERKLFNVIFILAAIFLYLFIFCLGKNQLFGWSNRQVGIQLYRHNEVKMSNIFGSVFSSLTKLYK